MKIHILLEAAIQQVVSQCDKEKVPLLVLCATDDSYLKSQNNNVQPIRSLQIIKLVTILLFTENSLTRKILWQSIIFRSLDNILSKKRKRLSQRKKLKNLTQPVKAVS